MMQRIITQEEKQRMCELRKQGMTCRQVAQLMGVGKTTVSDYTKNCIPSKRKKRETLCRILTLAHMRQNRPREDVLYDVRIYFIRKHPGLVIARQLDHRPTYSDMMLLCKDYGIPAVDFEDDRGTKIDDRVYHGTVYAERSRAFFLARFTIHRLKGEVYPEDFFR